MPCLNDNSGKEIFRFKDLFVFPAFRFLQSWFKDGSITVELKRTWKTTGQCPKCGKKRRKCIGRFRRRIRDMDIGGVPCFIEFDCFRISCSCGYREMEQLPFCNKYSRCTRRLEKHVVMLCQVMTIKDAAKETGLDWITVKNIDKNEAKKYVDSLDRANPTRIGVDEIAYTKGHNYLTVVRDVDKRKVIHVGKGRKKETLDEFFRKLGEERSKRIELAVMDMWDPYIASVKENTNAEIVFDKFHVAKKINEAMDNVRKREFAESDKDDRKLMKKKRFLILKRNENLEDEKREELNELMDKNQNLYAAYLLKEHMLDIMDEKRPDVALRRCGVWFRNVLNSGIKEFVKVSSTMKTYWDGIKNYFKYQITNAGSEGFNNKINVIKRRAYGFRDIEYFTYKIIQLCGNSSKIS